MENEDDSLVQVTGCDGALQQEVFGIPFQGQVHSCLSEELKVKPSLCPKGRPFPLAFCGGDSTFS